MKRKKFQADPKKLQIELHNIDIQINKTFKIGGKRQMQGKKREKKQKLKTKTGEQFLFFISFGEKRYFSSV